MAVKYIMYESIRCSNYPETDDYYRLCRLSGRLLTECSFLGQLYLLAFGDKATDHGMDKVHSKCIFDGLGKGRLRRRRRNSQVELGQMWDQLDAIVKTINEVTVALLRTARLAPWELQKTHDSDRLMTTVRAVKELLVTLGPGISRNGIDNKVLLAPFNSASRALRCKR